MSGAYYNEIDPYAAQWLRNLIAAGHIADGVVDERSIEDVCPSDLAGFTQCHFFAGIGVWSLALRRAGWPDDRPVWTGSCPCQPFSSAGKGAGFADERHLWPAWHHLIKERRPAVVFGEQVASADGLEWLDLVSADMEAAGYAFGAADLCAAGVGAPHIRQRLWFVAHADDARPFPGAFARIHSGEESPRSRHGKPKRHGATRELGDAIGDGLAQRLRFRGIPGRTIGADARQAIERAGVHAGRMANDHDDGRLALPVGLVHDAEHHIEPCGSADETRPAGPINGFWRAADWIFCRDGKWRPVEPGTFPLAHGAPSRVGRLRAYGNAINVEAARVFIQACM